MQELMGKEVILDLSLRERKCRETFEEEAERHDMEKGKMRWMMLPQRPGCF